MEIWKYIERFEGKYQVSNTGKVRSIDRIDVNGRFRKGIELKQLIESQGYYRVTLWHNRHKKEDIRVHNLVAAQFIPNPENKKTINHIDGNKLNNNVSNLEWNTYSENHIHAYKTGLRKPTFLGKFGKDHPNSKKIQQFSLDGILIETFDGLMDANRKTGIDFRSISSCANGYKWHKTAGGFIWKYVK